MQEIDELVDDWTPEPLAVAPTPFEEAENEKRPVIVGYAQDWVSHTTGAMLMASSDPLVRGASLRTAEQ